MCTQNYAQAELSEVEQVLCDVTQSVERIRRELVGGIEDKRDSVIGQGERIVSKFEMELSKLKERRARLEAQATSEDHISFLQVQRVPWRKDFIYQSVISNVEHFYWNIKVYVFFLLFFFT